MTMQKTRGGYKTDDRILDAIEAITGGNMMSPDNTDPARRLWADGYSGTSHRNRDAEMRAWLDAHRPGWRTDAPLWWGEERFGMEG